MNRSKWVVIIIWLLSILLAIWLTKCYFGSDRTNVQDIEYVDSTGTYHKIYNDLDFEDIKKMNQDLYDSLKIYQDNISYLLQFDYHKHFSTGKIFTENHDTINTDSVKTYDYFSEPNDTFQYHLQINSSKEPNWYSIEASINDKFTIVNKTYDDGTNHITIDSDGEIENPIIYKKTEKKSFFERFKIGPAVTVGYDPINRNFGMVIGFGVSFDIY